MPKLLAVSILLFLLLGAGYGLATIQAARSIPWDCSDWQAFAHDDRTTSILESLAENRGKTLYCGIDQSDTFSKAETWQAGKDRNERDDTIYSGERGIFRGFIAAQEGWLTDGESGITGVSRDRIFEFPREEKRRVKRVKRIRVGSGAADADTCMTDLAAGRMPGNLLCSDWGGWSVYDTDRLARYRQARHIRVGIGGAPIRWEMDWRTSALMRRNQYGQRTAAGTATTITPEQWMTQAEAAAVSACRSRGARYVAGSADFDRGHNANRGSGNEWHGDHLGWFYDNEQHSTNMNQYRARARQSRAWTATCKKTIRRTR